MSNKCTLFKHVANFKTVFQLKKQDLFSCRIHLGDNYEIKIIQTKKHKNI